MKINNLMIRCISALLCLIMLVPLCTSCAELTEFLEAGSNKDQDGIDDSNSQNTDDTPVTVEKKGGVYTVLIVTESKTPGTLASVFVCSFDTVESKTVSFLQIPLRIYTNNEYVTVGNTYSQTYGKAVNDGDTAERARDKGINALASLIEKHFCIYVDYYLYTDPARIGSLVEKLGGIEFNLPYTLALSNGETLIAGKQTLSGAQTELLMSYPNFSENAVMNLHKAIVSAIYAKAKANISNEMVSLFVMEIRSTLVTDIPSKNGEDIFFVRQLITCSSASVRFTEFSTQPCAVAFGMVEIINKAGALELINSFLGLYKEGLKDSELDAQGVLTDAGNQAVNTIYSAGKKTERIYTSSDIDGGSLPMT